MAGRDGMPPYQVADARRLAAAASGRPRLATPRIDPEIRHKDGAPWHVVPVPPLDHHCWVQTSGWAGPAGMTQWLRCPCGGIADGTYIRSAREVGMSPELQDELWLERNSRPGGAPPRRRRRWLPWRRRP